jgi:hypothetical protein
LKTALVGKYWQDNNIHDDEYERIDIVNPLENDMDDLSIVESIRTSGGAIVDPAGFLHPNHDLSERSYDVMLLKLRRPSTKPIVKVNFDPNLPHQRNGNEIVVVGLGRMEVFGSKADVLQQVYVDFLPYDECIDYAYNNVDYKFELLPDMMCTLGVGIYTERGQCYGDSGGPYLTLGNSYQEDLQVGIVSWAVNCASQVFPMVGSRTSASESFIRDITCAITFDPSLTPMCQTPTGTIADADVVVPVTDGVTVSVNVFADPYPHEISWKITSPDQSLLYAQLSYGSIQGDHDFYQVDLTPGQNYVFSIHDAADDGIFGDVDATLYEIVLTEQGKDVVLLGGDGIFAKPLTGDLNAVVVYVFFEFGDYHEDLAWSITDAVDETNVFVSKGYDTYRYGDDVTEEISLPTGQYHFIVQDRRGTDEYRAFDSYRISYQNANGDLVSLLESQGAFLGEILTQNFTVPSIGGVSGSAGSGTNPPVTLGGDSEGVCVNFGMPCQVFSDCCSGRCASGVCRTSNVTPNRDRARIGAATRGGAAGRSTN